jgi:hypothetical protein
MHPVALAICTVALSVAAARMQQAMANAPPAALSIDLNYKIPS